MEENVCRFKIPMQNILIIEFSKCTFELSEDLEGFWLTELSLFLDVFCKCSAVTELINEIVIIGSA